MPEALCPNCRAPALPGQAFCSSCGAALPQQAATVLPTPTMGSAGAAPTLSGDTSAPSLQQPPPPTPVMGAPAAPPQAPPPPAAAPPPAQAPPAAGAAPAPGYAPPMPGYAPPGTPGYVAPAGSALSPAHQLGRDAFVPRILAFIVDGLIVGFVSFLLFPLWAFMGFGAGIFGWWFWAILMALYMIIMESNSGQTLGKSLMHVKVVREDMQPAKMNEAQARALAILLYPLIIPMILDLLWISEQGQSLGDRWARAVVVKVP